MPGCSTGTSSSSSRLKFIKVIYIIGAIVIGLGALSFIVAGFSPELRGGDAGPPSSLSIGGLLYLIFFRVWLEVIAMLFRIGENTSRVVVALGGQPASGVMDPGPAIPPPPPMTPPAPADDPRDSSLGHATRPDDLSRSRKAAAAQRRGIRSTRWSSSTVQVALPTKA